MNFGGVPRAACNIGAVPDFVANLHLADPQRELQKYICYTTLKGNIGV